MKTSFHDIVVKPVTALRLRIGFELRNESGEDWAPGAFSIGWQFYDPETNRFISEGQWIPLPCPVPRGSLAPAELAIDFRPEPGAYRIYVSTIREGEGWAYAQGAPFLEVEAAVESGQVHVLDSHVTTARRLRTRGFRKALPKLFTYPVLTISRNWRLIRSMARRDVLARYRGSFGDVFWTVLNPLLLMSTYFFVFGVVLHTRFGADGTSTGFALYFLAGMLPWLAFSEPVGRAPQVIPEHRNFVKKLIFPLETLPVNQVTSGFVTELFAMGIFLIALLVLRHGIPGSILWLPVVVIPQILFTLGICWFLAALGAYMRDLGQIMGFVLTLWFFITPICYPETSLPGTAMVILKKNPLFVIVRAYRAILLEGHAPDPFATLKLWAVAIAAFLIGHAVFYKWRKTFADVI